MTRFLFIAIAVGIIYLLLKGDKKKKMERDQKRDDKLKASGDLVKDPVCGSYVDVNGQIRVRQGESVHHFCSYECRDAFMKKLEGKQEETATEKAASQDETARQDQSQPDDTELSDKEQ